MSEQILTLDQLMALPEAKAVTKEVAVPGWPGKVVIRQYSLLDQREMRAAALREDGSIDWAELDAQYLHRGLVEPAVTLEQARQLLRTQYGPLEFLLTEIVAFSGLALTGELSAKAVADAERRFRKR